MYAIVDSAWGALPLSVPNPGGVSRKRDFLWERSECDVDLPFWLRGAPLRTDALQRFFGAVALVEAGLQQLVEAGVQGPALSPTGGGHDMEHLWASLVLGLEKAPRYMGLYRYSQAQVEIGQSEVAAAGLNQQMRAILGATVFAELKCAAPAPA